MGNERESEHQESSIKTVPRKLKLHKLPVIGIKFHPDKCDFDWPTAQTTFNL